MPCQPPINMAVSCAWYTFFRKCRNLVWHNFYLFIIFFTQASCSSINQFLQGPLGRYLLNVSTAAEECSRFLCSFHGRCLRRHPDTDTYLHLDPQTHTIVGQGSKLHVKGEASVEERRRMIEDFRCQCYSGYQGERCDLEDPLQQRGDGHALKAIWIYLLSALLLHLLTWAHQLFLHIKCFAALSLQMLFWKGHVGELEIETKLKLKVQTQETQSSLEFK